MRFALTCVCISTVWVVNLAAQVISGVAPGQMPNAMMPWNPNFEALKQAVGLTDDQVKQLRDVQQSHTAANQALYTQIAAKQKQMNDLLNAGSSDAAAIGQLQIDINRLRTETNAQTSNKDQMQALLTSDQKAKLAQLEDALQLQRAANEAVQLGLLSYPVSPAPYAAPVLNLPRQLRTAPNGAPKSK